MSVSGVTIEDECVRCFNEMKIRHDKRYIIYRITDDQKTICIEKIGDKSQTYEDFRRELLQADGPRYAIVDYEYKKVETGLVQDKLIFVFWCPDTSKIKMKMVYASSKDSLVKPLNGLAKIIQANDAEAIDEEEVQALLART
jgi:cofilin